MLERNKNTKHKNTQATTTWDFFVCLLICYSSLLNFVTFKLVQKSIEIMRIMHGTINFSPYPNLCCQIFLLMATWKPSSLLDTMPWFFSVSHYYLVSNTTHSSHFHGYRLKKKGKNTWHLLHVWKRTTFKHPSKVEKKKSSCVVMEEHFINTQMNRWMPFDNQSPLASPYFRKFRKT